MDEKILQKKESISSVASKIGEFIIRPLINSLEIIKAIGRRLFERAYLSNSCPKKKPLFSVPFWKGSLRDICARHKISDAQILRRWITKYNSHDKETGGRAIMTKAEKLHLKNVSRSFQYCIKHSHNYSEQQKIFTFLISRPEVIL